MISYLMICSCEYAPLESFFLSAGCAFPRGAPRGRAEPHGTVEPVNYKCRVFGEIYYC